MHLQQLRKALVFREEAKRVEEMLKQVPTKRLTMRPLEELSKRMRLSHSREELQEECSGSQEISCIAPRFARCRASVHLYGAHQSG